MAVTLNPAGMAAILSGDGMQRALQEAGEAVAENVRNDHTLVEGEPGELALPVQVDIDSDGGLHAAVSIAHPSGEAVQSKHGSLTKAAAQAGLDVGGQR